MHHNRIPTVLSLLASVLVSATLTGCITVNLEQPTPEPAVVQQPPSYNPPVVQPAQPGPPEGPDLSQYEPMPLPQIGNQDPPPHLEYPFSAVGLLSVENDEWVLSTMLDGSEDTSRYRLRSNGLLVSEDRSNDPDDLMQIHGVWYGEQVLVCSVGPYGSPEKPRISLEGPCAIRE